MVKKCKRKFPYGGKVTRTDWEPNEVFDYTESFPGKLSGQEFTARMWEAPVTKRRLISSGYSNPEKYQEARAKAIRETPTNYINQGGSEFDGKIPVVNIDPADFLVAPYTFEHEYEHAASTKRPVPFRMLQDNYGTPNMEVIDEQYDYLQGMIPYEKEQIRSRIKKDDPKSSYYYDQTSEGKGDINAVRRMLYDQGVDIFNKDVTPYQLKYLKDNTDTFIKNRMFENYSDEDLLWLLNNIAQSEDGEANRQIQTAAEGGVIKNTDEMVTNRKPRRIRKAETGLITDTPPKVNPMPAASTDLLGGYTDLNAHDFIENGGGLASDNIVKSGSKFDWESVAGTAGSLANTAMSLSEQDAQDANDLYGYQGSATNDIVGSLGGWFSAGSASGGIIENLFDDVGRDYDLETGYNKADPEGSPYSAGASYELMTSLLDPFSALEDNLESGDWRSPVKQYEVGQRKAKEEYNRLNRSRERQKQSYDLDYNNYASIYPYPMGGIIPYDNKQNNDPNSETVELEDKEVFRTPDGKLHQVDGKTHKQGGEVYTLPVGTEILGKKEVADGKTYKEVGQKLKKLQDKHEKILEGRPTQIAKATSKRMLDKVQKQYDNMISKQELSKGGVGKFIPSKYNYKGATKGKQKMQIGGVVAPGGVDESGLSLDGSNILDPNYGKPDYISPTPFFGVTEQDWKNRLYDIWGANPGGEGLPTYANWVRPIIETLPKSSRGPMYQDARLRRMAEKAGALDEFNRDPRFTSTSPEGVYDRELYNKYRTLTRTGQESDFSSYEDFLNYQKKNNLYSFNPIGATVLGGSTIGGKDSRSGVSGKGSRSGVLVNTGVGNEVDNEDNAVDGLLGGDVNAETRTPYTKGKSVVSGQYGMDPSYLSYKPRDTRFSDLVRRGATYLPAAYNIRQGLSPYDTQDYRDYLNPYRGEILSNIRNNKYNVRPELERNVGSAAIARRNLRNLSPSKGALMGNLANISAGRSKADAQALARKQNIENQWRTQGNRMLLPLGQHEAAARYKSDIYNARAEAARDKLMSQGMVDVSKAAQFDQLQNNYESREQIQKNLLEAAHPLYMIGEDGKLYYRGYAPGTNRLSPEHKPEQEKKEKTKKEVETDN